MVEEPDADPFAVVAEIDGYRMRITAGNAQAAAAAAAYVRAEYPESTVAWFLRDDLAQEQTLPLLVRWRADLPGGGESEHSVHAITLVPGEPVPSHPVAYCGVALQRDLVEICPIGGVACPDCLRVHVAQTNPRTAQSPSRPRAGAR